MNKIIQKLVVSILILSSFLIGCTKNEMYTSTFYCEEFLIKGIVSTPFNSDNPQNSDFEVRNPKRCDITQEMGLNCTWYAVGFSAIGLDKEKCSRVE